MKRMLWLVGSIVAMTTTAPLEAQINQNPGWTTVSDSPSGRMVAGIVALIETEAADFSIKGQRTKDQESDENAIWEDEDLTAESTDNWSRPGMFDPDRFFTVLDHLSMAEGYSLDYIYAHDGMGGMPVLHAVRRGEEIDQIVSAASIDIANFTQVSQYANRLEHVVVDGTPDGYLQLVLLDILGESFYLFWHAQLNNVVPICGRDSLERVLKLTEATVDVSKLPIEPRVLIDNNIANVVLLVFNMYRGLIEYKYTIDVRPPHRYKVKELRTIIRYTRGTGVRF